MTAHTQILKHFIGGERVSGDALRDSENPSDTGDIVASYPQAAAAEVDAAVRAAHKAFPAWSEASPEFRSDLLDKIGELILQRREEIGRLLSREEGKTAAEGIGEVTRAGRIFKYFAGEALRLHGQNLASTRTGVDVMTSREPLGVFGLITPWNFPIAIPAWKSAPALAFGNTVVIKPASPTPATASALAEIIHEAGVPAGVFNMVFGDAETGNAIVQHPLIEGISFTGSQRTGAKVGVAAMARQARVQLEMGGKNPLVVLDDADLARALMCALDGAFFATGQRCTASSRIIVTEGIHDRFVTGLADKAASLRVGDALDPRSQMGPIVNETQMKTTLSYVEIAKREGGRILTGGERLSLDKPGWYVSPAVISDTTQAMRVNAEEIFGPVASVIRVKDYDEALAVANAGEFGLSAGIVTSSLKYARNFQRAARAGMVMVNLPTAGVDYHVPFGGSRKSSYGAREQGFAAVEFYTQTKTTYLWGVKLEVTPVAAIGAELGEGPVWVARDEALWFVDILGERVHRYQPSSGEHHAWPAPAKVSFIVPIRGGGYLAGLKTGLYRFDSDSGAFTHFATVEAHLPDNRLNDACVDRDGELWFGSMDDLERDATGTLYRLTSDGRPLAQDGGYIVTNGPAFSPCGRLFYHTDSSNRVIFVFDRSPSGDLSGKRVFVRIEADAGYPDGTTVYAEGCVWVAMWRGWAVRRYSAEAKLLSTIPFPCANVTKIAFAGEDLRTVYATTASCGVAAADRAAQPRAGDLFSFRSPVPGLAASTLVLSSSG